MTPTTAAVTPESAPVEESVAAHDLDVGRADEDEDEAGQEGGVGRHERADDSRSPRDSSRRAGGSSRP